MDSRFLADFDDFTSRFAALAYVDAEDGSSGSNGGSSSGSGIVRIEVKRAEMLMMEYIDELVNKSHLI